MRIFELPDLGEGLQEAEIVAWHVAEGDDVCADQPMVSVETAKAVVDIPAPHPGRIVRLFGRPGDVAHVGAPLVGFEGDDEDRSVSVVGSMAPDARELPASVRPPAGLSVRAAPAVRALARRLHVDLSRLRGTGPEGVILADDVRAAASENPVRLDSQPLHGVRKAMAQTMTRAAEVTAASLFEDADIESWTSDQRLLLRLIRAIVVGVHAEPGLNAWYDSATAGHSVKATIDLAIAVDTPHGLFVPVLRHVHALSGSELESAVTALLASARTRSLEPQALQGGTITLSNFGAIAGRYATPVVVPPTVAILGAGRVRDAVRVIDRQPAVRRILPLSLTFDHRCVTGGEAARFVAAVISDLELAQ